MERFSPLMLAILTVVLGAASADHLLTRRAIPELKPPAKKLQLTMQALMVPVPAAETPPAPPPPVFEPGAL